MTNHVLLVHCTYICFVFSNFRTQRSLTLLDKTIPIIIGVHSNGKPIKTKERCGCRRETPVKKWGHHDGEGAE